MCWARRTALAPHFAAATTTTVVDFAATEFPPGLCGSDQCDGGRDVCRKVWAGARLPTDARCPNGQPRSPERLASLPVARAHERLMMRAWLNSTRQSLR